MKQCGLRISRFWVVVIPATSKGRIVNRYFSEIGTRPECTKDGIQVVSI